MADDAGDLCKLLVCKILAAVLINLDYCLITGGIIILPGGRRR